MCLNSEDTADHLITCAKLNHEDLGKLKIKYILDNIHEHDQNGRVSFNLIRQRGKILKQMKL